VVPEYEYVTVNVSEPCNPDCEYESVQEPPKFTVWLAPVTESADAANVIGDDVNADVGPVLPAASTTPFAVSCNCNEPSWHCVTTTLTDEPDVVDGVNTQPCAVPAFEKSPAAIPDTDSLKATPNVNDIADAGEEGVDVTEAVGGSTSIFIVGAAVSPPGPFCIVDEPRTAFCNIDTITVPVVTEELATVREYVDPEPVNSVTAHPVLVPEIAKSLIVNPVTSSEKTML
jgi:hypothetical protein